MMQGFFIDIQGTLIDDKNHLPLPGSIEFLDYLNSKNIPYILITNNTKRDSVEFQNYLKNLGFKFDNYLDPLMVLDEYVKNKKIAPFGGDKFLELMQKYEIDYKNPESVVLGLKLFSNDEIAEIIELLLKGCELIGMHKTSLYHKNNKRYPGLGAILEMLKYATGREYVTVGKPSVSFFQKASEILGVNFDKITIISDDLKGDLLPAKCLNMKSVLVLSGKIKSPEEITQNPDFIFKNLDDLLKNRRDNGR
jgi:NagD protein